MKNLRLYNVSIHRVFYQNRFIYECAKKKEKKKIKDSWSHRVFVGLKRTYILNNIPGCLKIRLRIRLIYVS